jgi:hypothetical protein
MVYYSARYRLTLGEKGLYYFSSVAGRMRAEKAEYYEAFPHTLFGDFLLESVSINVHARTAYRSET